MAGNARVARAGTPGNVKRGGGRCWASGLQEDQGAHINYLLHEGFSDYDALPHVD